jgi:cytochrome P450
MTTSAISVSGLRTAPGPKGLPIIGSLLEAWRDPIRMLSRGIGEHGDVVAFRFAWLDYYVLNSPAAAHRVLVENARAYHKSPNYQGLKVMLGQGLLTSEGEVWRRQRKLAQPAFHREKIASFVRTMADCTSDMLGRWALLGPGTKLDVHAEMMRLTLRIVGKTLLSADLEADAKQFGEALNVAIHWANAHVEALVRFPVWMPTPANVRFRRAQRLIEGVILRVVEERRASGGEDNDLLGMLMSVRDEATGERMSDRQLLDELLTLTLAGHETTANALAFTFHLLSQNAAITDELRREVDRVLGDRAPGLEDLPRMPFTKAVIEESLRLYPPAWMFERIALEEDEVLGFRIPKGTFIGISPYTMHRKPEYFPDPERFDPRRFLEPDTSRPKLSYLPFGGGPRTCIGNTFALTEMQILLPMIVRRAYLGQVPDSQLKLDTSITLRPRNGVPMTLERAS